MKMKIEKQTLIDKLKADYQDFSIEQDNPFSNGYGLSFKLRCEDGTIRMYSIMMYDDSFTIYRSTWDSSKKFDIQLLSGRDGKTYRTIKNFIQ